MSHVYGVINYCASFLLITGLELTLPYLSPLLVGEKLVIGANFASTGLYSRFVSVIKLLIQLKLF